MSAITKGVIAGMPNTRYRQGGKYAADMAVYMRQIAQENEDRGAHDRLVRNLVRCIREEVSPRQRELLLMYYVNGLNQCQIAAALGVNKSTVSRTISRGEQRLRRCLRYGAERYLRSLEEP